MIEQAVRWQYAELIPRLVYRVFPVTPPAGGGPAERLLEFVDRAHARHLVVAGLFGRLFGEEQEGAVWVGGCYLAGTGRAREEQAFLADVFAQMAEGQNLVAWTEPALAEERQYARWTAAGYGGIFLLCAGVAALAVALL